MPPSVGRLLVQTIYCMTQKLVTHSSKTHDFKDVPLEHFFFFLPPVGRRVGDGAQTLDFISYGMSYVQQGTTIYRLLT